ncbi:unnamed protein product, partial [Laminaria digitata]
KGLSTTRFHQGFQRRKQSHIRQDEARLEREACKQRASLVHLQSRRQRLGRLDKRNGFNLITGQFDPANKRCTTPFHIEPRTRKSGSLSKVAERAEYLLLRDSEYKFHAPAWSGENHDKRQDLLQREGINKPKKSALLGIGGADLASVGAEDMFSKATYDPAKACAVEGLVETSVPGRYTPRKLAAAATLLLKAPPTTADYSAAATTTQQHTVSSQPPSRQTIDSRGLMSTPAPATVFRVIPAGLGYRSSHRAGRGEGGSVSGIAPIKRFCESQSAPSLGLEQPHQARKLGALVPSAGMLPTSQALPLRSPRETRGGSGSGRGEEEEEEEEEESESRRRSRRSSALSQSLTRSHSDFARGRPSRSGSAAGATGECSSVLPGRADALQKSASLGRLSPSLVCDGLKGSGRSRLSDQSSRGASPAQRRHVDQLALDFAAVRSLEP